MWVKPIYVVVYNQEKQGWLILLLRSVMLCVCLYVCEVLAPADASETEQSDLRHVPGAKVKGHHIQTYPEKLSVRERRGLWDHLTNTLTHNIIYYQHSPVSSLLSVSLTIHLFSCASVCLHSAVGNMLFTLMSDMSDMYTILICSWCRNDIKAQGIHLRKKVSSV